MANADPNNSVSTRTVDDVFQVLIARDVPPLVAKKQITEALQLGKLRIDSHIAAGACKTRPMRQATPEELKAAQAGKSLDFLYEAAPASGITAAVDPQSWDGGVFALAIRDGHLVIEPRCSLEFPWSAYSFSMNPVVIDELWPTAVASKPGPMLVSIVGPVELIDKRRGEEEFAQIRKAAEEEFGKEWASVTPKTKVVNLVLSKMNWDSGKRDTVLRALGWRKN
jgi:hypothetical protein